jgi:hypothetical protein
MFNSNNNNNIIHRQCPSVEVSRVKTGHGESTREVAGGVSDSREIPQSVADERPELFPYETIRIYERVIIFIKYNYRINSIRL